MLTQLRMSAFFPSQTQEELEEVLFDILRKKGYGDEYVQRYQVRCERPLLPPNAACRL